MTFKQSFCSVCEEQLPKDDKAKCEACGEEFCSNCQAPFLGPPHPPIDYPLCMNCYELGGDV